MANLDPLFEKSLSPIIGKPINTHPTGYPPVVLLYLLDLYTSSLPSREMKGENLSILDVLVDHGIIELQPPSNRRAYELTPRGTAFIKALCRVPAPRAVFADRDGIILE